MVKELTSHRKMSKLVCNIKARDNAGRLPRHYIDDDKFEPDEIDYMKRIIGKTKYTSSLNLLICRSLDKNSAMFFRIEIERPICHVT